MAPSNINATITAGQRPGAEIEEQAVDEVPGSVGVPPHSVSIYELPAKRRSLSAAFAALADPARRAIGGARNQQPRPARRFMFRWQT